MERVEFCEKIIASFEVLLQCQQALSKHIAAELKNFPVWVLDESTNEFSHDHEALIAALNMFEPDFLLSPQETKHFPGAVGCTLTTIDLIDKVNLAKDQFSLDVKAFQQTQTNQSTQYVRDLLKTNGYGTLSLKHVYRHIYYIKHLPERISWSKTKAFSNVVITIEQARTMLEEIGIGSHIDIQLAKLTTLNPGTKLVKQRKIKPCWAANITTYQGPRKKRQHQKITASLPIFYLGNEAGDEPEICLAKPRASCKGKIRADKGIENEPFLPSISVYRALTR